MSIIKSLLTGRKNKAEKEAQKQVQEEAKQEAQKIVDSADIKPSDTDTEEQPKQNKEADGSTIPEQQPKQAKADNPTPPPSQQVGERKEEEPKQKGATESNEEKQEVTTSKVVATTSGDTEQKGTERNKEEQKGTERNKKEQEQEQEEKPIHERLGMTEQKYTKMLQYYSPQELEYWYGYNPEEQGNALEMIYKASNKEPTEPNAKEIEKRKRMAAISDSLGLLAQMFSHSRGAVIPRRDSNKEALPQLTKREQDLYDKYNKDKGIYEQGLYKAMGDDFLRGLQERGKGRQGASSMMATMESQQANRALKEQELADRKEDRNWNREYKAQQEQARRADKDKDRALRYAELNARNKSNQDRLAEQKRLNDARIKGYEAKANGKSTSGGRTAGTGGKSSDPVLIINPTDKYRGKTETNRVTGEQTIAIRADKDLIRFFANKAKESDEFKEEADNVYNKTTVTGEITWDKDDVIANAYIQWLFNNGTDEEIEVMRKAIESYNLTEGNQAEEVKAPTTSNDTPVVDHNEEEEEEEEEEEIDWSEFEVGEISQEELDSISSSAVL